MNFSRNRTKLNPLPFIWGLHAIEQCLEYHPELIKEVFVKTDKVSAYFDSILTELGEQGIPYSKVNQVTSDLEGRRHQGVYARLSHFNYQQFTYFEEINSDEHFTTQQFLYLKGVEDPHNLGALIRSAAAFNVKAIFVDAVGCAQLNGTVAQASSGYLFRVPIIKVKSFENLKDNLGQFYKTQFCALDIKGADLDKSFEIDKLKQEGRSLVWVLGSEGKGLSDSFLKNVDVVASIKMVSEVESLNVSVSGAIVMQKFFGAL